MTKESVLQAKGSGTESASDGLFILLLSIGSHTRMAREDKRLSHCSTRENTLRLLLGKVRVCCSARRWHEKTEGTLETESLKEDHVVMNQSSGPYRHPIHVSSNFRRWVPYLVVDSRRI